MSLTRANLSAVQRVSTLTTELREMQPAHRGLSLDAVAGIAERCVVRLRNSPSLPCVHRSLVYSHHFAAAALRNDVKAQARYRSMLIRMLDFAVDKLNDKGA